MDEPPDLKMAYAPWFWLISIGMRIPIGFALWPIMQAVKLLLIGDSNQIFPQKSRNWLKTA